MRRMLMLCFAILVASPCVAHDTSNDRFFKNYVGVVKLLRAHGVDPVAVNMGSIQSMCLGLKDESDPIPYNRCVYEKALDFADFGNDNNACEARAKGEYPDELLTNAATLTITRGEKITNVYERRLSRDELRFKRMGAFDACMSNKGWRDSGSAARGRLTYSE